MSFINSLYMFLRLCHSRGHTRLEFSARGCIPIPRWYLDPYPHTEAQSYNTHTHTHTHTLLIFTGEGCTYIYTRTVSLLGSMVGVLPYDHHLHLCKRRFSDSRREVQLWRD